MAKGLAYEHLKQVLMKLEQKGWAGRNRLEENSNCERELSCLYTILEILNRRGMLLGERLREVAAAIPQGWQYSRDASAQILLEDQIYTSDGFRLGPFSQAADIIVDGEKVGAIQVFYGEEKPDSDEGPFLKAERKLIDAIAERISAFVERRRAEEARQVAQRRLQEAFAKMLSGFLPICAKCKKIRDNAGEWREVETYIRDHTEAEFSHSICPQCAKKLYSKFMPPA